MLAVDLYACVFPAPQTHDRTPVVDSRSCGEHADRARPPVRQLLSGARRTGTPIFYTTSLRRSGTMGASAAATRRSTSPGVVAVPADYEIHPDFTPHEGDVVIEKGRPSAFFGTPLISYLVAQRIDTVIVCGESTSGCVRATVVDAHSYGLHVLVADDCVFDRVVTSHRVNLFDMHTKYADVLSLDQLEELLQWPPDPSEPPPAPTDRSTPP